MGAGSLMGQAGMGTMTWPLTQSGSTVTGSMSFAGMPGRMPGAFSGMMSGDEMTFTMDMRTTMTGTFGGSNSCTGSFTNGQMTMTRR